MIRSVVCAFWALLICGCATGTFASRSCTLTQKPAIRRQSIAWHLFDVTVLSQVQQGLNPIRVARKAFGCPTPSCNLRDGVVADSSFFTNRSLATLTPEEIQRGPTQSNQRPHPPFVVTRHKQEGKTAGFFVRDARGDRFLFKFDLPDYPELITAAEVVTSKLLYALGYNVPSYEIEEIVPEDLTVSPQLGITQEHLRQLVAGHVRSGRLRVSASRILNGDILGPFSFKRHRHCAELRALKLACAWVNNTDAKDHNTLMVWTGNEAVGYLIDFGTSLGANAARGPKGACQGWVNDVDIKVRALEALTFGLYDSGCDPDERLWSAAVGLFSPKLDPIRWKPYAPNIAFEEITKADARWIAARLAKFTHAQLEAAVGAGQYRNPLDAARIVEVLEARRNAIVQTYLSDVTPTGNQ